jgi:hypothetical protein
VPLTGLAEPTAALIWRIGQLFAVAAGAAVIVRAFFPTQRWLWLCAAVLLLSFAPVTLSVRLGQIDGLLLLLMTLAVALSARRRDWLSGMLYGLIGILKVYPAATMLADLIRRRWQVVLGAVVGAGGIIVLSALLFGVANEIAFWRDVAPSLGLRMIRLSNQSLYGLIGRTFFPELTGSGNLATRLPLVTVLHGIAAAGVAVVSGWAIVQATRAERRADEALVVGSLVICAVLLVIPVSWDHYQVLLIMPLLAAGALAVQNDERRMLLIGAFALLAYGTYKQVTVNRVDSDLVLFLASYRTFGLLLLWFWWVGHLGERRSAAPTISER